MPEKISDKSEKKLRSPAKTPEEQENRMINYAMDLAEKQLREGTASSQVITHFLKAASARERLEREKLELENQLTKAKTEVLQSQQRIEELYSQALNAMRVYSGQGTQDE